MNDDGNNVKHKKHESISEILIVVDENSLKSMSVSYGLCGGFLYNMQSEVKLCGAPVDTLRLTDLYNTDLSQYKLIVFANAFNVDNQLRKILKENARGKTYVWNYASGILNPNFSFENVCDLTGFKIKEFEHSYKNEEFGYEIEKYKFGPVKCLEIDFPLIEILSDNNKILKCYPNGKVMCASRKDNDAQSVFCAFPSMTAKDFRNLAEEAGCKMYAPLGCTVYADNRIIGFFSSDACEFSVNLGKKTVCGKNEIFIKMPSKGAEYFLYD